MGKFKDERSIDQGGGAIQLCLIQAEVVSIVHLTEHGHALDQ